MVLLDQQLGSLQPNRRLLELQLAYVIVSIGTIRSTKVMRRVLCPSNSSRKEIRIRDVSENLALIPNIDIEIYHMGKAEKVSLKTDRH